MRVLSTNISEIKIISFRGKDVHTGIFKKPISEPIFLGKEDVKNDSVVDRRYHGGIDKACYLYSFNHYKYWQEIYPQLEFEMGMFGENITINNLEENKIFIGDIFKIGTSKVQISQPREPCFKLGAKFGSQKIVKQFLESDFPGMYLRVLEEGFVQKGDEMVLVESPEKLLTVLDVYHLFSWRKRNISKSIIEKQLDKILASKYLAEASKRSVMKVLR